MIYTIGHSTRGADELVALLRRNGVELLVDVRRYPGSRRHPQFNREALAATLPAAGIAYRHAPELGGRRTSRRGGGAVEGGEGAGRGETGDGGGGADLAPAASPNRGWRSASFRAYADHMSTPEFRSALERLEAESGERVVAVMCSEAVPWRCHRQLIADALVLRGHEVRHIVSASAPSSHEPNPMARPGPEGIPTYPAEAGGSAAAGEQPDLFEA